MRLKELIILLLFLGCSSGKNAFEKGNYTEALYKAVERLRADPDNTKAKETLAEAFPLVYEYYNLQAKQSLNDNLKYKWEKVVSSYETWNSIHERIFSVQAAKEIVPQSIPYTRELQDSKNEAGTEREQDGDVFLGKNTRDDAKTAYSNYGVALKYVPERQGLKQKQDSALNRATLRVLVTQLLSKDPVFQTKVDYIRRELLLSLNGSNRPSIFVKFLGKAELPDNYPYPMDHQLDFSFESLNLGQLATTKSEKEIKKDSVVVSTIDKNGVKIPVYATVSAKVIRYTKTVTSTAQLVLVAKDKASGSILYNQMVNPVYIWRDEWGTYSGDDRALTKEEKTFYTKKESAVPERYKLFEELSSVMQQQLLEKIVSFYRNY